MINLRQDQLQLKHDIYNAWNEGARNVLMVLPTGGGKSVIFSDIIYDGVCSGLSQAIIAHRNELVSQMSAHVARRGIPHKIIGAEQTVAQIVRQHRELFGKSFVNPSALTAVVGVDTLLARRDHLSGWARQIGRWALDEGHHLLLENKWGTAVEMFPNAHGIGGTATPSRADGKGLGRNYQGVYDAMVLGPEMRHLINIGALSDYEIVCPKSDLEISDDELGASGDWSAQKLKAAAKKSKIVGDVVTAYCRYAYGKRAICFATDVETASHIARSFEAAGIKAAALSAKTPLAVRDKFIREFKSGILKVLVNVDLFDEGFDVPDCEVVIMARPTASLAKYRQMAGRALRAAPGKAFGLIIDHVSNVLRHGLPDKFIPWTLAQRDKRGRLDKDPDELDLRVCTFCTRTYYRILRACPRCGKSPPLPEPRERSIEMVDGDLVLLDRAVLEAMRAATILENPGDIGQRVLGVAGENAAKGSINKQLEKIAAAQDLKDVIAQWAAIERAKGFEDYQIYRKFYLTTGTDILTALSASRTRQDYETLTARIRGWF